MESIFELLENLNLVLAKLDPELGTALPQLVGWVGAGFEEGISHEPEVADPSVAYQT